MKATTTMSTDFLGADGGRLAMAFAAGCVATFTFVSGIGAFIWKFVGQTKQDRIDEISAALKNEQDRCAEMEKRLVSRIEQLETILLFEAVGNVRQGAQIAIAELRQAVNDRINESEGQAEGDPKPRHPRDF